MIGFLTPGWLWALPAALLPLLVHLVARRQPPTVSFPAVRYLQQVTREHQRRLRLQHLLLLAVRTLLILALVLAAANPTIAREGLAGHAPAALVLILDNSPSSGARSDGAAALDGLRQAARQLLARATEADAVWLLAADGLTRRAAPSALRALVDSLTPAERRMDLGAAVARAGNILANEERPGEIVVLSDLQATALSPATVKAPVTVFHPDRPPPPNLGVAALDAGPQPWLPGDHRVAVSLAGDSSRSAPLAVSLGDHLSRPRLASAGAPVDVVLPAGAVGWFPLSAQLDPDEFREDDRRSVLVRVAPVARVHWDPTDRFLAAAAATLVEGGRLREGADVSLGTLGPGPSVVLPPADLAALGALNRALERRGSAWRYGGPVTLAQRTDPNALVGPARIDRRIRLVYTGGAPRGVAATVAGEPWIAAADGVVLVGSRFDPAWTDLPASPTFVPLVDALANRLVRGEQDLLVGAPGEPVRLPDVADSIAGGEQGWRVEGGGNWEPPARGTYLLLAGGDTVGALAVNLDPRESDLARATDAQVEAAWPTSRVLPLDRVAGAAFAVGARGQLRAPLLALALVLGLLEVALASGRRRA